MKIDDALAFRAVMWWDLRAVVTLRRDLLQLGGITQEVVEDFVQLESSKLNYILYAVCAM